MSFIKDYRCPVHDSSVHSYDPEKLSLLCSYCNQNNKDSAKIRQIPEIVHQLKTLVKSEKLKKSQCLLQLKYVEDALENELENIKLENLDKIDDYFSDLEAALYETREECKQNYIKEFSNFKNALKTPSQLSKNSQDIKKIIFILEYLTNEDENGKITEFCESCIQQSSTDNMLFYKDIEDPTQRFDIQIKDFREEFTQSLNSFCKDNITYQTNPHKFETKIDDLNSFKNWFCHTCESKNSSLEDQMKCIECGVLKPIELYESFFKNYRYATPKDIKLLSERKKIEQEIITKANESSENDTTYCMIDEGWMTAWDNYIKGKTTAYSCQTNQHFSEIPFIPYPGEICNSALQEF